MSQEYRETSIHFNKNEIIVIDREDYRLVDNRSNKVSILIIFIRVRRVAFVLFYKNYTLDRVHPINEIHSNRFSYKV